MTTKKCTKCGEEKPLSDYYYDKKRERYHSHCRSCHNKYKHRREKERRDTDSEFRMRYNKRRSNAKKKWRRENPIKYHEHKAGKLTDPNYILLRRKYNALADKRNSEGLKDKYIITQLMARTGMSYLEVKQHPELIEQKRAIIQTKRVIKQTKRVIKQLNPNQDATS